MSRACRLALVLASIGVLGVAGGCGGKKAEPAPGKGSAAATTGGAAAGSGGGTGGSAAAGTGSAALSNGTGGAPAGTGTGGAAPTALPAGRDPAVEALVKAGAACAVEDDDISLSCAERVAAGDYAFQHQQSVEVAATCVVLLRDANLAVKLVASHCLDQLSAVAVTPVLGAGLDALEAEPDPKVRRQIAWGLKGAEATTAGLTDRVLALVDTLAARPDDEDAAGNVLDTLFPQYLMSDGPKPPVRAQQLVLAAFARPGGGLFIRACDLVRLVEDKPAACKAVADAIAAGGHDWWRALPAFNDVGVACADVAPRVLDATLAQYAAGHVEDPRAVARFATLFELSPPVRKRAAAALRAARKATPEWQRPALDEAIAAMSKAWAPPPAK